MAPEPVSSREPGTLVVGSKAFSESRILAEMMAQMIESHTDVVVERKPGLGGTLICLGALQSGELDLYPDYTGTGWAVMLRQKSKVTDPLRAYLQVKHRMQKEHQIVWLQPFGFNNSYVIAMSEDKAAAIGATKLSDLVPHAKDLKAGFSTEFLNRGDGFPGLKKAYGFDFDEVRGMEHGLAYEAINSGQIDLVDAYTTDGKLLRFPLRLLEDDLHYFPPYHGAPLIREDTLKRLPEIGPVLDRLAFVLPDLKMQKLNYQVEAEGRSFAGVARTFLLDEGLLEGVEGESQAGTVRRNRSTFIGLMRARAAITANLVGQHLFLTLVAVLLAAVFAIPIGIIITRRPRLRQLALGTAGVIQTIPSLALLAFMIPIPGLGIGVNSAISALFLYALLPILRNTYTGIVEVNPQLIEAARGIGLTDMQILRHVELPLAVRTIMAGIRTSTVISVGVATLAAFIGAGGLGEPIITGLQLNDANLILTGAIPAAVLALAVDFLLSRLELAVVAKGISAPGAQAG